jgi:MYXO-CTERM domain-containing protein
MRAIRWFGVGAVLAVSGSVASTASAAIYLSGVVWYGASANGGTTTEPAEYDNIVGTGNFEGRINAAARDTTFLLNDGANSFSWDLVGGNYNGLSMYFATDAGAFNRAFGSAPDLVVYGSSSPLTPVAGALVQTNGVFSGTVAYGGNSSFVIGDRIITVTAFDSIGNGSGRFTLNVTPIPTPGGVGVLALAGVVAARRRRAVASA